MKEGRLLVVLFFSLLLISGCAHISKPKSIPDLKLDTVGSFSKQLSVDLINAQPDITQHLYAYIGFHKFYANYNEWTKFFIDKLTEELKERGAVVVPSSPNKLKVKLSDFVFMQGFAVVRVTMKVNLEMPEKKWEKEWVATDVSGWNAGRAFGSTIYHAIEQILKDQEIIKLLQVNG